MAERKFKIGQSVTHKSSGQLFLIVARLAERDGVFEYVIRLADGEREEIAKESDLSATSRRRP
jgi:hypothetical protein